VKVIEEKDAFFVGFIEKVFPPQGQRPAFMAIADRTIENGECIALFPVAIRFVVFAATDSF